MTTEQIQDLSLEEIIGDRFGRYSKYIIQDRALPDARDGLKPVQRRILYAMLQDGNTSEKAFRKSAKAVGNVIANYHPHGDRSVYDAMVRMSQPWKMRVETVEMHGNNGSVDGDPSAAMRYTEARLSAYAEALLQDIDKETVDHMLNFDDSVEEPTVLPARLPNLLINGSTGISAGYATDIPPHALHEVVDAVLLRMKKRDVTVPELMKKIKGPDFPTGGIIQGTDGIRQAYETGKGRCIIRSKTDIESLKAGKSQIVVTEIPYDVNKATLVKKMDELRIDKKLDGIAEIRDESDRTGLRIVIELKKDIDPYSMRDYLLKNTDLQVTYNFNMVAISDRRPQLMSLPMMLDAYIDHQRDVVRRRATYDVTRAEKRLHIVEGLVKALSILDDVIRAIRAAHSKKEAKQALIDAFHFSEQQAEAVVSLQLYRLTNTDVTALREEQQALLEEIAKLRVILNDPSQLDATIEKELKILRSTFKDKRMSVIEDDVEELKVDLDILVPSEQVVTFVTKDGYVKRTSLRSYSASKGTGHEMKEGDYPLLQLEMNTHDHVLLFTSKGNYLSIPVHELPDIRWRDLGQHVSSIASLDSDETLVTALAVDSFDANRSIVTVAAGGHVKQTTLDEFVVQRMNRTYKAMNLKREDELVTALLVDPLEEDVVLLSDAFRMIRFSLDEVTPTGTRTAGVIGIQLEGDERVTQAVSVHRDTTDAYLLVTDRGTAKRLKLEDVPVTKRALRGTVVMKQVKSNPYVPVGLHLVTPQDELLALTEQKETVPLSVSDIRFMTLSSNGTQFAEEKKIGSIVGTFCSQTEED